jgi:hypothetical protein
MAAPALDALRRQRLPEVEMLLKLRPKRQLLRRRTNATADPINRACVVLVLLVPHLEGYIEDLVGGVRDELDVRGPATDDVPRILLAAHVVNEVEVIAELRTASNAHIGLTGYSRTTPGFGRRDVWRAGS